MSPRTFRFRRETGGRSPPRPTRRHTFQITDHENDPDLVVLQDPLAQPVQNRFPTGFPGLGVYGCSAAETTPPNTRISASAAAHRTAFFSWWSWYPSPSLSRFRSLTRPAPDDLCIFYCSIETQKESEKMPLHCGRGTGTEIMSELWFFRAAVAFFFAACRSRIPQ